MSNIDYPLFLEFHLPFGSSRFS